MVDIRTGPDITLEALVESWARHMRAANLSPRTIYGYTLGTRLFLEFAVERGMPTDPTAIRREHVEAFIEHVLAHRKPSTAATYYKNLQQLFKWLAEEGEIPESPMTRMRAPKLDEQPVPVVRDEYVRALLDVCAGRAFNDRRDTAILRLFMNTGARLSEIAELDMDDVDLDHTEITVLRKGGREQILPLGPKAVKALDRYLRVRHGHPASYLVDLWLGSQGALTASGIQQMLRRRCHEAGIPEIHPHQFRHTWAHQMKSRGASDETLRTIGGWKSPTMLTRYAASTAAERAREVHFRLAPGEDY